MTLREVKISWNKGLARVKKAEKVAEENPELFDKYLDSFLELCREMSGLMYEHERITGKPIPKEAFDNGFKQELQGI